MGREFNPDLIIVSSDFDAADGDTDGNCNVSPSCYRDMKHMFKSLARGNLCVVLEGDYNLDSIAINTLAVAKFLIGELPREHPDPAIDPKPEAIEMIDIIKTLHARSIERVYSTSGTIYSSASLSMDNSLHIIDWSTQMNFGLIDINDHQSLFEQDNYSAFLKSQEYLIYIWDNQIKYIPSVSNITFIGIGEVYSGVVRILSHRDTKPLVKSVIGFVGNKQLKALDPLVDDSLYDWYTKNSLLFEDKNHSFWGENESKRPRKHFGRVLRHQNDGISNIIAEKFKEATEFVSNTSQF